MELKVKLLAPHAGGKGGKYKAWKCRFSGTKCPCDFLLDNGEVPPDWNWQAECPIQYKRGTRYEPNTGYDEDGWLVVDDQCRHLIP